MTINQKALNIIKLAEQAISGTNVDSYKEFITELKMIIINNNSDIINLIPDLTENTTTLIYILNELESLATTIYVEETSKTNIIQQASLIAIPIMFVGEHRVSIPTELKPKDFNKLLKVFNASKLCTHEDSVILYNHLCMPNELLNLNMGTIYNITNALLFQKDSMLPSLLDQSNEPEVLKKDTLILRYLIGMFVSDANNEITNRDTYDEHLKTFMETASEVLASALNLKTLILLPPYDYYEAFRFGLDTYTVTGIKIQIQHLLTQHRIHPHGIQLNINIEDMSISIMSKLENQSIKEITFDISYVRQPQTILQDLATQLKLLGINSSDMLIQHEKSLYKLENFIKILSNTSKPSTDVMWH